MESVHAYNAKINQVLGDKKGDIPKWDYPVRFGIELEYEVNTPPDIARKGKAKETQHLYRAQIAERVQHTYKGFAFAKHDGSLKNGFEVVSIPLSLDAHRTQWNPFFEIARENGLQIRSTCGMHVHVSRELLSPLQIGKMIEFVFNKNHTSFIRDIAGRKPPVIKGKHYAEMEPKKITDINRHRERYSALNLTNSETIEFRIFKSTLNIHHVIKNIEFCDALVRWTWPGGNASIGEIRTRGLDLFFEFMSQVENRKRFPYLADFMKSRGYIDWKVKKPSKSILKKIESEAEKKTNQTKTKRRGKIKEIQVTLVKPKPNVKDWTEVEPKTKRVTVKPLAKASFSLLDLDDDNDYDYDDGLF